MLSSSNNFMPSGPGYGSNYPQMQSFTGQQGFMPQNLQDHSMHQSADPNSPDVLKQNIRMIHESVVRLQAAARSALAGIRNAYHPGSNPAQTEADIATLKQTLVLISDMLRHSGVGALPILPLPTETDAPVVIPDEQKMMADTTQSVQVLYETLRRNQESAQVVANLLGATEHAARGGR